MKKFKLIASCITLTCLPAVSFAFFCPSNFNQIDFGMSPDQVTQQCGKPDKQTEAEKENENIPQSWDFYLKQPVATGSNAQPSTVGTMKSSFVFDADGKLINMSVNGIGVGASSVCGKPINLGATRDEVKAACGDPGFVSKSQASGEQQKPIKVIEFEYSSANPPATLVFENGVLTSKK